MKNLRRFTQRTCVYAGWFRTRTVIASFLITSCLCVCVILHEYYVTKERYATRYPKRKFTLDGYLNFIIPEEATDPTSAYYGMEYMDTYGLPISSFTREAFKVEKEDWRKYFPGLVSSIGKYKQQNEEKLADAFTSTASISIHDRAYKVGDYFVATLRSRDRLGREKKFGGDYYRARLISEGSSTSHPDGVPCHVRDHGNGSYTIQAPLLTEDLMTLEVKLILPVEGVDDVINKTSKLKFWGHTYIGAFEDGPPRQCNVDLGADERFKMFDTCDYSNPRNREPWICFRLPGHSCSPITYITYTGPSEGHGMDFGTVCSIFGCHINIETKKTVAVLPNSNDEETFNLPTCDSLFETHSDTKQPSGYFKDGRWMSLLCKSNFDSLTLLNSCLANKVIYFFGDSTIRQFFSLVVVRAGLWVDGPDSSVVWQQPKIAYHYFKNITMYYRAHGPPLQNPGPPSSRPYVSDSIDGIQVGGKAVYVILNIGAHLVNYEPAVYIRRLKGIKAAVERHLKRFPDTRFIIRGQNVAETQFEWILMQFEVILREIFKDMKNVLFLNLWDLSTMWPLDNYHPWPKTLDQQALLMFQYVCT